MNTSPLTNIALICTLAVIQLIWHSTVQVETLVHIGNFGSNHLGQQPLVNPLSILGVGLDLVLVIVAVGCALSCRHESAKLPCWIKRLKVTAIASFSFTYLAPVWYRLQIDIDPFIQPRSHYPDFPPNAIESLYASGFCTILILILILLRDSQSAVRGTD